jgi:glycosyltransferase involved in cell wall biosynthesis
VRRRAGTDSARAPRVVHISSSSFGGDGLFGGGVLGGSVLGGTGRYPIELARAMAARTPTTLVGFAGGRDAGADGGTARTWTKKGLTEKGLTVRVLPIRARLGGSPLNPLSEQLLRVIAGADIVHLHQWESVLSNVCTAIAAMLRKPVFVTDHGGSETHHRRRLRLHRRVAGLLSVSDFAASRYPEFAHHAGLTTVYAGVDTAVFAPNPAVHRGSHAVFVGQLLPHTGVDVLISALDPYTELRVVGRPDDEEFFQRLQRLSAGKKVSFHTEADDAQLRLEYQQARVAVLPSVLQSVLTQSGSAAGVAAELLGTTLIEAMACGTPVICTQVGGLPEVVINGITGYVVPPGDRQALAARVRELSSPTPDWARMSKASRDRAVDTFTWSHVADRCLRAYRAAS